MKFWKKDSNQNKMKFILEGKDQSRGGQLSRGPDKSGKPFKSSRLLNKNMSLRYLSPLHWPPFPLPPTSPLFLLHGHLPNETNWSLVTTTSIASIVAILLHLSSFLPPPFPPPTNLLEGKQKIVSSTAPMFSSAGWKTVRSDYKAGAQLIRRHGGRFLSLSLYLSTHPPHYLVRHLLHHLHLRPVPCSTFEDPAHCKMNPMNRQRPPEISADRARPAEKRPGPSEPGGDRQNPSEISAERPRPVENRPGPSESGGDCPNLPEISANRPRPVENRPGPSEPGGDRPNWPEISANLLWLAEIDRARVSPIDIGRDRAGRGHSVENARSIGRNGADIR